MVDIATIGLILILIGWLVQLLAVNSAKQRVLDTRFLVLYLIGVLLLTWAAWPAVDKTTAYLNGIIFIFALITLWLTSKR